MENQLSIKYYLDKESSREQIQDIIDDIIDNFDFEKVHKVMEFLNWQYWDDSVKGQHVPDIHELRAAARRRIKDALREIEKTNQLRMTYDSGGFVATVEIDPDNIENEDLKKHIFISLSFVLEGWNNYY